MGKKRKRRRPGAAGKLKWIGLAVVAAVTIALVAIALDRSAPVQAGPSPAAEDVSVDDGRPLAVFLGDSYTHGTGASDDAHRWSTIVAESAGWQEKNFARGGTGYLATSDVNGCGQSYCANYQEMVPDAVSMDPDIVIVAGGQNDYRAYGTKSSDVTAAISATYNKLRADLPDARIIAVGPSVIGPVTEQWIAFDAAVQAAAAAVSAEYVSLIAPDVLDPSMGLPDGGHVNDAGHAAIAARVSAAITA